MGTIRNTSGKELCMEKVSAVEVRRGKQIRQKEEGYHSACLPISGVIFTAPRIQVLFVANTGRASTSGDIIHPLYFDAPSAIAIVRYASRSNLGSLGSEMTVEGQTLAPASQLNRASHAQKHA